MAGLEGILYALKRNIPQITNDGKPYGHTIRSILQSRGVGLSGNLLLTVRLRCGNCVLGLGRLLPFCWVSAFYDVAVTPKSSGNPRM